MKTRFTATLAMLAGTPDTSALAWKMLGGVNSITRISPLNVIIACRGSRRRR